MAKSVPVDGERRGPVLSIRVPRSGLGHVLAMALLVLPAVGVDAAQDRQDDYSAFGASSEFEQVTVTAGTCHSCIRAELITLLGDREGPGTIYQSQWVTRDTIGRYWVLQWDGPKIFAPDGTYLTSFGRSGEGPGEFTRANHIHRDDEGTIHIFDVGNLRRTSISSELEVIDDARLPGGVRTAVPIPRTGAYMANMFAFSPELFGYSLHLVESDSVNVSFGLPRQSGPTGALRHLAIAHDGRLVTAHLFKYELELWDQTGARTLGLVRQGLWEPDLDPTTERPRRLTKERDELFGSVSAIGSLSDGRLIVASWVPKVNAREALVERVTDAGDVFLDLPQPDQGFDTVIEILDVDDRRVVASTRLQDVLISGFLEHGHAYGPVYDADGTPRVGVWALIVQEPTGSSQNHNGEVK